MNYSVYTLQSPETESLHSRSWIVKSSFNHIQSFDQNKRDVFYNSNLIFFTIFYGPFEKWKALYSVKCILLVPLILYICFLLNVLNWAGTVSYAQILSDVDLGYGLNREDDPVATAW